MFFLFTRHNISERNCCVVTMLGFESERLVLKRQIDQKYSIAVLSLFE